MSRQAAQLAKPQPLRRPGAPSRMVAVGELNLRVRIPEGTPVNRVALAIGREIARSIREAAR